jgi:heat shock protein HtpX
MTEPVFYKINQQVPPSYNEKLFDFIYTQYLLAQKQRFANISRETTSQGDTISYVVTDAQKKQLLQVEVKSGNPLELKITPIDPSVSQTALEEAKQDILIAKRIFEENARNATVYFAWREGEEIVPEAYTLFLER